MEEVKKYLIRISTGEIIECENYTDEFSDLFFVLTEAKFSHEVTFGGEKWTPKKEFKVAIKDVVYILEKDK